MPPDYPEVVRRMRQVMTRRAVARGDRRMVERIRRARSMRDLEVLAGEEWDQLLAEALEG